ncbi:unnamed protein product [Schistosoma mattheei]|uniref:Uncharacterized protein n=1 Tax=Schistosoma mattheei TaxID=31246 RepID=A0A3P8CJI5_9TREM|nr:unnamed protein product [Schistosoma mattheei]
MSSFIFSSSYINNVLLGCLLPEFRCVSPSVLSGARMVTIVQFLLSVVDKQTCQSHYELFTTLT